MPLITTLSCGRYRPRSIHSDDLGATKTVHNSFRFAIEHRRTTYLESASPIPYNIEKIQNVQKSSSTKTRVCITVKEGRALPGYCDWWIKSQSMHQSRSNKVICNLQEKVGNAGIVESHLTTQATCTRIEKHESPAKRHMDNKR
ncbi:hypothetical protein Y032_0040g260 [Ancylostoma ceylanicum]|uniref:Uncharacterized protein n=1 Tax=Ancylostoma ceylanicum TaxID=53326 RepID=A0A016UJ31_9BILA|nr:hypothetical protein Y032_0040g260 [Ancylostoma ceylanicum]